MRRLHRGGEGQYLVNGAHVRRTDVVELLADVGLGSAMGSIVSQGRVEAILASKPEERRVLVEEAAGLGRFKRRRHRAELKLARVAVQVERARDVEAEVAKRLRPLALQATAAERAEKLGVEIAGLRAGIAAIDLATLGAQLEAAAAPPGRLRGREAAGGGGSGGRPRRARARRGGAGRGGRRSRGRGRDAVPGAERRRAAGAPPRGGRVAAGARPGGAAGRGRRIAGAGADRRVARRRARARDRRAGGAAAGGPGAGRGGRVAGALARRRRPRAGARGRRRRRRGARRRDARGRAAAAGAGTRAGPREPDRARPFRAAGAARRDRGRPPRAVAGGDRPGGDARGPLLRSARAACSRSPATPPKRCCSS